MKKLVAIFSLIIFISNSFANQNIAPEPSSGIEKKQNIITDNSMVVAADPRAVQAGLAILRKGGNAVDSAIAVQMVLNVVEPHASGIGGGGFLLYYDAKTKKTKFYDGRETAPKLINDKVFLNNKGTPRNFHDAIEGGLSVGTPGLLKMLKKLHDDHGKLPWKTLFEDAIKIANDGFKISPRLNKVAEFAKHIQKFPTTKNLYIDENNIPKEANTIVKNPELAKTFQIIAKKGIKDFYQGKIAQNIVNTVNNTEINPGFLRLSDLKNYQPKVSDLLCAWYHEYKICSADMPSSGGLAILQILGILENFDLAQMEPNSVEAVHVISEAIRLVYADRAKYAADGDFVEVPIKKLLNKKYLKERSFLINIDSSLINVEAGVFDEESQKLSSYQPEFEPPSTTQISIIDKNGNAISFTSSIEYSFGSGVLVKGFLLNNQLTDFSFSPEIDGKLVANRIEPGKKPRSSMTPTFIFDKDNNLKLIIGSPGGARIIAYVLKTIIAVLDWNIPINDAVALPNFTKMGSYLELEENTALIEIEEQLKEKGHEVKIRDMTSGIHAIYIDDQGKLHAGVDTRREGAAAGE